MKSPDRNELEALEKDPVWDLVRASPRAEARPDFSSRVVRAARLEQPAPSAWQRWFAPVAISTGLAAAAAVVLVMALAGPASGPSSNPGSLAAGSDQPAIGESSRSTTELTPVEDGFRTEVLIVAAENPGDFSDAELVSLISY